MNTIRNEAIERFMFEGLKNGGEQLPKAIGFALKQGYVVARPAILVTAGTHVGKTALLPNTEILFDKKTGDFYQNVPQGTYNDMVSRGGKVNEDGSITVIRQFDVNNSAINADTLGADENGVITTEVKVFPLQDAVGRVASAITPEFVYKGPGDMRLVFGAEDAQGNHVHSSITVGEKLSNSRGDFTPTLYYRDTLDVTTGGRKFNSIGAQASVNHHSAKVGIGFTTEPSGVLQATTEGFLSNAAISTSAGFYANDVERYRVAFLASPDGSMTMRIRHVRGNESGFGASVRAKFTNTSDEIGTSGEWVKTGTGYFRDAASLVLDVPSTEIKAQKPGLNLLHGADTPNTTFAGNSSIKGMSPFNSGASSNVLYADVQFDPTSAAGKVLLDLVRAPGVEVTGDELAVIANSPMGEHLETLLGQLPAGTLETYEALTRGKASTYLALPDTTAH